MKARSEVLSSDRDRNISTDCAEVRCEQMDMPVWLQTVVSTMADGLIVFDMNGNVLDMNPAALQIHRYGDVSEARKHLSEFPKTYNVYSLDGRLLPIDQWPLTRVLRGETFRDFEIKTHRTDIDHTWIGSYSGTPIIDENGEIRQGVITLRDVTEKSRTEEALRESEEKFRVALAHAQTVVFTQDLGLRYTWYYNPNPGFAGSTVIGKTDAEIFPRQDAQMLDEIKREVLCTGKGIRSELRTTINGEAFYYDTIIEPTRDADGAITGIIASAADITERKQAEADVERMRHMLSEGQAIAHLGSFEYIVSTGETVWSDEECRIYGLAPGSQSPAYTDMLQNYIHPDDAVLLDEVFRQALETETIYKLEHRIVRADGSVRTVYDAAHPYYDGGKLVKYIGVTLDITERKQAEESLAAAHRQIQSIIDNTTDLVYAVDLEERFLVVNAALAQLLRSTPEQMIGKRRHEFMPKVDADWHEANDRQVMEAGKAMQLEEYSQLEGRSIIWLSTKFPLRDAQGDIYAVGGIVTDVSERRQAEKAALDAEVHKRDFYRKTILAATGGKLEIVEPEEIREFQGDLVRRWNFTTAREYSSAMRESFELARSLGLERERLHGFMSCAGEMLGNAQKHAGGGTAFFYQTDERVIYVVSDTGPGIDSLNVPDIAFVKGYSTAGTGGMGYKLIIECADKTYLATGPGGTTVAIEMKVDQCGVS